MKQELKAAPSSFHPLPRALRAGLARIAYLAILTGTTLTPALCRAHDGDHGSSWFAALAHLLTEPDHLLGIVAAVLAVAWLVRRARRSR